jgi:5-carboxymethyl-2-hydroxymuconate isomerase
MPHLTLEYTAGLRPNVEFEDLFARLHVLLSDTAGIKQGNCKSRAIELSEFYVGDGTSADGFVHLAVRFLEGRSAELKQEVGRRILAVLGECFGVPAPPGDGPQITVQIEDIERAAYFKLPGGSLDYGRSGGAASGGGDGP